MRQKRERMAPHLTQATQVGACRRLLWAYERGTGASEWDGSYRVVLLVGIIGPTHFKLTQPVPILGLNNPCGIGSSLIFDGLTLNDDGGTQIGPFSCGRSGVPSPGHALTMAALGL